MSENESAADSSRGDQRNEAAARVRESLWPGWIWALPVAATFFVIWLILRTWVFAAPTVVVTFAEGDGLGPGTPVRHKGVQVGEVEAVRLAEDLDEIELELSIEGRLAEHLREGTRFWVVRPSLGSGVTALLAGAYVAMLPGKGEPRSRFSGLAEAPVLEPEAAGRRYLLHAGDVSGLGRNAPVLFDGMEVGRVIGLRYREELRRADIHLFVRDPYTVLVRDSTVFWKTGGLTVSRGARGLAVELPRLRTLAGGAVAFHTPEPAMAEPSSGDEAFMLHPNRAAALAEPVGPRLAYRTRLPGAVGGLKRGAPVELGGVRVGRVNRAELLVDAEAGELSMPVTLVLEPARLGIEVTADSTRQELRARLDARLERLVASGLRARAASGGLVAGGSKIELARAGEADSARLVTAREPPEIPAIAAAPGLAQAVDSLAEAAGRVEDLPISTIAANLRRASARIARLTGADEIQRSLASLDSALADLENLAATAARQGKPLLSSLRETATAAESAAAEIEALAGEDSLRGRDLPDLINEVTESARALRRLADYLQRHPEALLQGRGDER